MMLLKLYITLLEVLKYCLLVMKMILENIENYLFEKIDF